ncbi:MAG: YidC/Oxa1 family membrane protein insertase [Chromatiales bacterium]|nr:YidC/Oxa1 family membrane protein insertase [Chromatiales bacterium]
MELWELWLTFITNGIDFLSAYLGVSEALAIIVFTLLSRMLLMPLSLKSSYLMYKNRLAVEKIRPEVERLREIYSDNPGELAKRTMAIYKKNGIRFIDRTSIMNIGSQGILGISMFQALRNMAFSSKFIWIADIAKPDVILAFMVGVLTFASMLIMPGTVEQQNFLMLFIPTVVVMFVLASFPSALGLYWATSNAVTIVQTLVLRVVLEREDRVAGGG